MKLGDWIPQIFYDIIGRIVPGAMLIIIGSILFVNEDDLLALVKTIFLDSEISSLFVFFVFILASYFIAILMGSFGFFIKFKEWEEQSENKYSENYFKDKINTEKKMVSLIYDALHIKYPQAAARCAKLRSEKLLCRTLISGLAIFFVIWGLRYLFASVEFSWYVITILPFSALALFLFHQHLNIRLEYLLSNHWYIMKQERVKYFEKKTNA